ncbi:MAG: diguanylate cyclase, partial [Oscillospiraceae bacterium]
MKNKKVKKTIAWYNIIFVVAVVGTLFLLIFSLQVNLLLFGYSGSFANMSDRERLIILISLALIGAVGVLNLQRMNQLEKDKETLRITEEEYRIAASQGGKFVMRYDVKNATVYHTKASAQEMGDEEIVHQWLDAVKTNKVCSNESSDAFIQYFEDMARGVESREAEFCLHRYTGALEWYHFDYTLICDIDGTPSQAVISYHNVTEQREMGLAFERYRQKIESMSFECKALLEHNLTRDVSEHSEGELMGSFFGREGLPLNECARRCAEEMVCPADRAQFIKQMDKERLTGLFYQGEREISFEFCRFTESESRWTLAKIELVQYPNSGDIKAFLLFSDVDDERREFERLEHQATLDSLTGLLNHEVTTKQIEDFLQNEGKETAHALFIIDVDKFKDVNDEFGHQCGDHVLLQAATALKNLFRPTDIVGRIGGDEFMVLLKNAVSWELTIERAREVCETMQFLQIGDKGSIKITASVGVAVSDAMSQDSFSKLFSKADAALYEAKRDGRNRYVIANSGSDEKNPGREIAVSNISSSSIQLKALIDSIDGGILLIEVGEEIHEIFVSAGYYAMTQNDGTIIKNHDDLRQATVFADDIAELEEALRTGAQNDEVVDHVYRGVFRNNDIGWRHLRAVRIPYEESELPVLIAVVTDISKQKQLELSARFDRMQLRCALDLCDAAMFKCDFATRTLHRSSVHVEKYGVGPADIPDVPESLIKDGIIHPDSAEGARNFYNTMFSGVPDGSMLLKTLGKDGQYQFVRTSYKTIFDENNIPLFAVCISKDAISQEDGVLRFKQQDRMLELFSGKQEAYIKANLTKNCVEAILGNFCISDVRPDYSKALRALCDLIPDVDERKNIEHSFSSNELTNEFATGKPCSVCDYHIKNREGQLVWVTQWSLLLSDPSNGDLYIYLYVANRNNRKKLEMFLPCVADHEKKLGLYSPATLMALTDAAIKTDKRDDVLALVMIEINLFDR